MARPLVFGDVRHRIVPARGPHAVPHTGIPPLFPPSFAPSAAPSFAVLEKSGNTASHAFLNTWDLVHAPPRSLVHAPSRRGDPLFTLHTRTYREVVLGDGRHRIGACERAVRHSARLLQLDHLCEASGADGDGRERRHDTTTVHNCSGLPR